MPSGPFDILGLNAPWSSSFLETIHFKTLVCAVNCNLDDVYTEPRDQVIGCEETTVNGRPVQ